MWIVYKIVYRVLLLLGFDIRIWSFRNSRLCHRGRCRGAERLLEGPELMMYTVVERGIGKRWCCDVEEEGVYEWLMLLKLISVKCFNWDRVAYNVHDSAELY